MGLERLIDAVQQLKVGRVVEVFNPKQLFNPFDAAFGQRRRVCFFSSTR